MRSILCLILLAAPLAAQPEGRGPYLLFLGGRLDACWRAGPGLLVVQAGERLFPFRLAEGELPVHDAAARARLPAGEDVAQAEFLDVGPSGWVVVGRRSYRAGGALTARGAVAAPLFRRPPPRPAIRLPLCGPGGEVLIPAADRFLVLDAGKKAPRATFSAPLAGDAQTGWGVGDDMLVTEEVPHLLALPGQGLLVGRRGSWRLEPLDGRPARALEPAPFDAEEGILDIPFAVPPLTADLSGSPDPDLLLCDPSAGVLFLYDDLAANGVPGFRVIRLGGLVLATWARDLDGDGRRDLVVLRTADLNPLAQLRVIRSGRVRAQVLLYRRRAEGIPASPDLRRRVEIPLRVGIQNGLREAELPQVLLPVPGPAMLTVTPEGRVLRLDLEKDADPEDVGAIPPGKATSAFSGVFLPGGATLFAWRTVADSRLYHVAP